MNTAFKKLVFSVFLKTYWKVGFFTSQNIIPEQEDLKKIKWIKFPHKEKWYADPFILNINDGTLSLLVEEFDYTTPKGVISLLEIDVTDGSITLEKKLLSLESHLSFPAILRNDNKIYVYPENSRSGNTYIYEYDENRKELLNKQILIEEPISDAILYNSASGRYIFATSGSNKNGNVVEIYKSEKETFHEYQKIPLRDNSARNGGDFIYTSGGDVIKVSQENNSTYGHAIVFQKLIEQKGSFFLEEVHRLEPFKHKMIGLHTYNRYKNYTVIDAKFYMHPFCGVFFNKLLSLIRR